MRLTFRDILTLNFELCPASVTNYFLRHVLQVDAVRGVTSLQIDGWLLRDESFLDCTSLERVERFEHAVRTGVLPIDLNAGNIQRKL